MRRRRPTSAFTMPELLVSMAVLAVVVVLLLGMVDSATKLWRANENRVDSYREARAALNIIADDLQAIFAGGGPDTFVINEAVGGTTTTPGVASTLFFLSIKPVDAQDSTPDNRGDLCSVGFFPHFGRTSSAGPESQNLYRYFRGSGDTFDDLKTGTFFADASHSPGVSDLLARNVTAFVVTAWEFDSTGNPIAFTQSVDDPVPDFLEITLRVINEDAAAKLDSRTDWLDRDSNLIEPVERTFTSRVALTPAPTFAVNSAP